ncbi:Uncharacterised protein [Enterobacter cloacae]|uniref:Uncharacterized protein n=1 Tax=Enterobacter cloacae TaxID=550 RepID=A0A377M7K0_ENTCL|nr:Uncharacterised protein [Enterobacter cloacae]
MDVTDVEFATPFRQLANYTSEHRIKKDAEQEESHARAI